MLERASARDAGPLRISSVSVPSLDMSSTGTSTRRSSCFVWPASTIFTGRGPSALKPTRKRATSSSGRCVAESPMRCSGRPASSSSRSSDSARCAPRLVATIAWISSTITVWTLRRLSRAELDSTRYSDSGVVMKMSAGVFAKRARSFAGVSPVRIATLGSRSGVPRRSARVTDADQRAAQVALDVDRERLQRRDVDDAAARRDPRGAAGRSRRGTPRASCPSRSARARACSHPTRSPATRAPARAWAPRMSSRTIRAWADGRSRGRRSP